MKRRAAAARASAILTGVPVALSYWSVTIAFPSASRATTIAENFVASMLETAPCDRKSDVLATTPPTTAVNVLPFLPDLFHVDAGTKLMRRRRNGAARGRLVEGGNDEVVFAGRLHRQRERTDARRTLRAHRRVGGDVRHHASQRRRSIAVREGNDFGAFRSERHEEGAAFAERAPQCRLTDSARPDSPSPECPHAASLSAWRTQPNRACFGRPAVTTTLHDRPRARGTRWQPTSSELAASERT